MQIRKFGFFTLIFCFILIARSLFSSEIDQFTGRERYQDSELNFTKIPNQYTNSLIQQGVNNFKGKNKEAYKI